MGIWRIPYEKNIQILMTLTKYHERFW